MTATPIMQEIWALEQERRIEANVFVKHYNKGLITLDELVFKLNEVQQKFPFPGDDDDA